MCVDGTSATSALRSANLSRVFRCTAAKMTYHLYVIHEDLKYAFISF